MSRKDELLSVWTEHKNIGYIPCMYLDYNFLRHPSCMNERPEGRDGYDWFGVHWTYEAATNAPNVTVGYPSVISDITKWKEQLHFPDLTKYDWEGAAAKDTADWDRENKVSMVMLINGIFERSHHLLGYENAMIAMYDEPEAYAELISQLTDYKCEIIRNIGKYYNPDIIMMHDDYGSSNSMMISPTLWREIIKEPLSRMIKTAHECGMAYEHHSCGYIEPIIGDLIEIGADSLNPLQRPCNDIAKIKELYGGKITLVGGFNSQGVIENPSSSLKDIENDIQYAYNTLAPGGGYVSFPILINMKAFAPILIKKHLELSKNYREE